MKGEAVSGIRLRGGVREGERGRGQGGAAVRASPCSGLSSTNRLVFVDFPLFWWCFPLNFDCFRPTQPTTPPPLYQRLSLGIEWHGDGRPVVSNSTLRLCGIVAPQAFKKGRDFNDSHDRTDSGGSNGVSPQSAIILGSIKLRMVLDLF